MADEWEMEMGELLRDYWNARDTTVARAAILAHARKGREAPADESEALLPCPFCGGPPDCDGMDSKFQNVIATCKGCAASSSFFNTRAEAAIAWNRRAAPPAPSSETGRGQGE